MRDEAISSHIFRSPQGRFDRPLPLAPIRLPASIEAVDSGLVWRGHGRWRVPRWETLRDFARLEEDPAAILNYARRWGVLAICEHDLPTTHNPPRYGGYQSWCEPMYHAGENYWDPFPVWRHFIREAHEILDTAARLGQGTGGEGLTHWPHLMTDVNRWLELGDVRLEAYNYGLRRDVRITLGTPSLELHPERGLFGALAIQLLFATAGSSALRLCQGDRCRGSFFFVTPKNRRYCEVCGKGARLRRASKRYYHKPR